MSILVRKKRSNALRWLAFDRLNFIEIPVSSRNASVSAQKRPLVF
jgi:hypothetical protein